MEIKDVVKLSEEFENYLEENMGNVLNYEQRCDIGRKLIEFLEEKEN